MVALYFKLMGKIEVRIEFDDIEKLPENATSL